VRPIGIGDVPCRIVVKFVIGEDTDIVSAVGPLQTCAGHAAGSEAAVHVMKELFDDNECEAALLGLLMLQMLSIVLIVKLHFIIFKCFVHPFQPS